MINPDYISAEDAKTMRFVDSIKELIQSSTRLHDVILCPRRLMGDFNALARWMDHDFVAEKRPHPVSLTEQNLVSLRDKMLRDKRSSSLGAERFAVTQIIKDMQDIQKISEASDHKLEPKLYVLGDDDKLPLKTEEETVKCCYLGPIASGLSLTDVWRTPGGKELPASLDPSMRKPNTGAPLRLVLIAS